MPLIHSDGKCRVWKIIFNQNIISVSYENLFLLRLRSEKSKALLLAPAGITAINIDGTKIHSALHIPVGNFKKHLPALNGKVRSSLRYKFSKVKAIIIDEISMVSNDLLFHNHLRLLGIFGCLNNTPFACLSIIVRDFLQLAPQFERNQFVQTTMIVVKI